MLFAKKLKKLSDEELVRHYQTYEDPAYIGELYERYTHSVYLNCMKYLKNELDSEDVSMRVFEKLMLDLKKYDIQYFRPWLHTVVRNMCFSFLDRKQRERKRADQFQINKNEMLQWEEHHLRIEEVKLKEFKLNQLESALTKLKPVQRECLELFYLQKKCYQDIADITGYSMKQVKSYLQNGKRNLLIRLTEQGINESTHTHI